MFGLPFCGWPRFCSVEGKHLKQLNSKNLGLILVLTGVVHASDLLRPHHEPAFCPGLAMFAGSRHGSWLSLAVGETLMACVLNTAPTFQVPRRSEP